MKEDKKKHICDENCECGCKDGKECTCEVEDNTCTCSSDHDRECDCNNEGEKDCDCKEKPKDKKSKLKDEIKKLEEENKALQEKVFYHQAELINYRKRKDEETSNMLKYANQEIITELITIADNFERAIKLDDNDLTDELSKFLTGFKMMYASLMETLTRFGVEEISRQGQVFDSSLEEALMTDTTEDKQDEEVLEVMLKGYKLKDRVIRPAAVKINKK